jgi:hypothetical protein
MVAKKFDPEYSETDYDYQLDLSKLSIKHYEVNLLFDLTAGLWNKGRGESTKEFVEQWEHNLIKIPTITVSYITYNVFTHE